MGIGVSIFLIAVGAILAFALSPDQIDMVNIDVVGFILMAVGLIGLIMTAFIWGPRNRRGGDVVEERRVYDDRV